MTRVFYDVLVRDRCNTTRVRLPIVCVLRRDFAKYSCGGTGSLDRSKHHSQRPKHHQHGSRQVRTRVDIDLVGAHQRVG